MDRKIVYPGQIPLETDLLGTNQNVMVALGKLSAVIFGSGGAVYGLSVAPNTPSALNVVVAPGEIYQLQNLEATAYSSLPSDTNHTVVKQGILLDAAVLACPAPTTAGFSINYLIEATYTDADIGPTVLPYYNASNPSQAYSGPGGSGAAQATNRAGQVQLQVKAGVAATTGTQVTPAVDVGYIALAVVTVANGQTTITAGNIVAGNGGQLNAQPVTAGRLLNIQVFTSSGTYRPYPGAKSALVRGQGAGSAGAGAVSVASTSNVSIGAGGHAGAYGELWIPSGLTSQPVTVGAGGTGVVGGAGGAGGASSFGSLMVCGGGPTSTNIGTAAPPVVVFAATGSPAAVTGTGNIIVRGVGALGGMGVGLSGVQCISGPGGNTQFGAGGQQASASGLDGGGYGAGGSGGMAAQGGSAQKGGTGAPGLIIVLEYA